MAATDPEKRLKSWRNARLSQHYLLCLLQILAVLAGHACLKVTCTCIASAVGRIAFRPTWTSRAFFAIVSLSAPPPPPKTLNPKP